MRACESLVKQAAAESRIRRAERIRRQEEYKRKDSELKSWLNSIGLEQDDVIRLKCCYNFVHGICTRSEVILTPQGQLFLQGTFGVLTVL